ncbi:hypothetical protein EAF04_002555 [Stromatinia cepivora]|nr:hypothetical protein EAF04_002555 [Stromatinia cepivora]
MTSPPTTILGFSKAGYPSSPSSPEIESISPTLQSLPYEVIGMIFNHLKSKQPRNVAIRCRRAGDSFEIYSEQPISIAMSVCRVSRQWAKDQQAVSLARRGGYMGSLEQIQCLYFNPELDLICPINEGEWSQEAFQAMFEIMQATKVQRIAVSDCSHSDASFKSPWASFTVLLI